MERKYVKDLMISLNNYAVIDHKASLFDAIFELESFAKTVPRMMQPIRSIIIKDDKKNIIGKIGHMGILKAFEPKYDIARDDMMQFNNLNMDASIIKTIMDKHKLWSADLHELIKKSKDIKVVDVMDPVTVSINENASIVQAIHKIIMYNVLALLVKQEDHVVGIIRLTDIYNVVVENVQNIFKVKI